MPEEDAGRVGVDDEDGLAGPVEDHAVGRLGSDARDRQDRLAQGAGREGKEGIEVAAEIADEHVDEVPQAPGLDVEIPRGLDDLGQPVEVDRVQGRRVRRGLRA